MSWFSSFFLMSPWIHANATQPKVRRWEISGFFPVHHSKGVELGTARDGSRFFIETAVYTASAQSLFGIPACFSIDCAGSSTVRLYLSEMPFCCCVYGADTFLMMPSSAKYSRNFSRLAYSPPPSTLIGHTFDFGCCFSTFATYSLNFAGASDLAFIK
jgi:hypothetical protein